MNITTVAVGERERLCAEIDDYLGAVVGYFPGRYLLERCRAALEASHAPVPREPTEAMRVVANELQNGIFESTSCEIWRAMFDAAAGTTPEAVKP